MSSILKYGSIVFYALTFIVLILRVHRVSSSELPDKRGLMLILWAIACLMHALYLHPQTFTQEGLNLTFYNAVSLVLFIISTLVLILSINKRREFLGLFLLPIVIAGIALTIIKPEIQVSATNIRGLQLHIVFSLFAFSVLTISAIQSILLLNQDRHLRNAEIEGMTRALPPLHETEKFMFQTITIGFALLSIALLTGFLFLENMFEQHIAHKTILSCIAWLLFAVLLWGRWKFGWRGLTAIRWTLGGFVFLILAYLGSMFVQEILLHRVDSIPLS